MLPHPSRNKDRLIDSINRLMVVKESHTLRGRHWADESCSTKPLMMRVVPPSALFEDCEGTALVPELLGASDCVRVVNVGKVRYI